jgi:hypothetical protein
MPLTAFAALLAVSSNLYETILPMVKAQVESQMCAHASSHPHAHQTLTGCPFGPTSKVRDLSATAVSIAPADFSSWHDVRTELMSEAKAGLKARVEAEIAAAGADDDLAAMKAAFAGEERDIEHAIDHDVHTFSATLDVSYNFLSH